MKTFTISIIFSILYFCNINYISAQGQELKYNSVLIIDNNQQTVPTGAVWKVVSIYGEERNKCVPVIRGTSQYYAPASVSSMYINGVEITSSIRGLDNYMYTNSNCTNSISGTFNISSNNKISDPNVFPMWLPVGTKLKSGGPNTFVSVIEFLEQ